MRVKRFDDSILSMNIPVALLCCSIFAQYVGFINGFSSVHSTKLQESLKILANYNIEYLLRIKQGRAAGKGPRAVEYERAQHLKMDGIKKERIVLQEALKDVTMVADEVVMGIMADKGSQAIKVLRGWVDCLELPRGVIRCIDSNEKDVDPVTLDDSPVYLKYNSTENGDCYMKPYNGEFTGVIYQPKLADLEFRQFGDFNLQTFPSSDARD